MRPGADAHRVAVDRAGDAAAVRFGDVAHHGHGAQRARGHDLEGTGHVMRRFRLERHGQITRAVVADPARHGGASLGERAGLVEEHRAYVAQALERVGVLDEDAGAGGTQQRHRERQRHGQAERARARDDQQRDDPREGGSRAMHGADDGAGEGSGGQQHHHEPPCHQVGDLQQRGLLCQGLLHDGEQGADAGAWAGRIDAHDQAGTEVGGAGVHGLAGGDRHRHGLAGEHGVVERGAAGQDDAVDGHDLAAPDLDQVAGRQRGQRHLDGRGVGLLAIEPSRELEERHAAQAVGPFERGALRAPLQLSGAEQGRHEHGQRVEPEVTVARHDVPGRGGRRDGDGGRDWQVDVHDTGAQAGEGGLEEGPCRVGEHGGRDQQRQPAEERLVARRHALVLAGVERTREEHQVHRAGHGDPEADEGGAVFVTARIL